MTESGISVHRIMWSGIGGHSLMLLGILVDGHRIQGSERGGHWIGGHRICGPEEVVT